MNSEQEFDNNNEEDDITEPVEDNINDSFSGARHNNVTVNLFRYH